MITIVEPKAHIDGLWGKQQIHEGVTYRMMKYVLRKDYDNKVLLHNVVTGQLVALEQREAVIVEKLPVLYDIVMEQLVEKHFLVPEEYDEHLQVLNLRKILRRLESTPSDAITSYTILPTTACNARCYYCFEGDVHRTTMTEEIVDATVKFIAEHCGKEKKVSIRWFGGEPTIAAHCIDRICTGLRNSGIQYISSMTTNGYLFDKEMVERAVSLWNLKDVMISVDGTEGNYNRIKSFVAVKDNPYQRVLRNVGMLLEQNIRIDLRMNFDLDNYQDFEHLLNEVGARFQKSQPLSVYVFPVIGEYPKDGVVRHGSDAWLDDKIAELNDMAEESGFYIRPRRLPSMFYSRCTAGDPSSMVIDSEGKLSKCTSQFNEDDWVIGSVFDGVNAAKIRNFYDAVNVFADPDDCIDCALFPDCVLLEKCPAKMRCFFLETRRRREAAMIDAYKRGQISNM